MRTLPLLLPLMLVLAGPAVAETPTASPAPAEATRAADKLRLLLDLVQDPEVRAVLDARRSEAAPPAAAADTMAGGLGTDLGRLRDRLRALGEAIPRLPGQFAHARLMFTDMLGHDDALSLALFLPLFVALGFGGEGLFRLGMGRIGRWLLALPLDTVGERVSAVLVRLGYGLGIIASFTLGSVGAMLPFDWTLHVKQILLALLLASVSTRLSNVVGRFLLAPRAPRFRVVPVETPAASYLFRRMLVAGLLLGIGSQARTLLAAFGFDAVSQDLCLYALGTFVLGLSLETVWHYPRAAPSDAAPPSGEPRLRGHHVDWRHIRHRWAKLGLSALLLALWCCAVAEARMAFWLLLFAACGPAAVVWAQRSIRHVMRPVQPAAGFEANRLEVLFLERGVRTLMIVGMAALLVHLLGLDVASLTMRDTLSTRVSRAAIGVIVVVLVTDFLWHVIAALIDRKLAGTMDNGDGVDPSGRAARLQTLLPITRNLSLAALTALSGTMVLASLGVEIGPLIASAGVAGVAIGFGAQTLVKDIISGIFYLVDDAFRIGEYIQSGSYKGTVESFSLRSVKLRHQRGALYTIPFGTLGAVQNLSRDWVVDKIVLNVPYDTDLDHVRKIIKRIGGTLAADEDLGAGIIAPIKLQGVAQFGDFAIQLQTKMTTVPGDVQFAARRRALLMIKQEFQANGIGFALPTVQVSGEGSETAAARRAVSLVQGVRAGAAE